MMVRLASLLSILFLTALFAVSSSAKAAEGWEHEKESAFELLLERKCSDAWPILWKWASRNNPEAMRLIATAILNPGMSVPGGSQDSLSRYRYFTTFMLLGLEDDDQESSRWASQLHFRFIREDDEFSRCVDLGSNLTECKRIAINSNLISSFDELKKEIDVLSVGSRSTCDFKERDLGY